ncbi:Gfo/Idh/MocA family oxidoreductase [Martelella lutilitoris]|uniref:Gfo/Idh/MocA family oxidoreductase n=1 Tax=Martelella lutilitoris TaxID=2583532 RepID=A0A5C4JQ72_9HYPH|nr:Gfo/Idh/MocA family oxidoreductase [Martelella lutilitoris]TNB47625.1 Gfo/Idh/MocA family oxidoreductase [Martelella lutilitoris]
MSAPERQVAWGILGPGTIANNFAVGLSQTPSAKLLAAGGRTPERLAAFGERHGVERLYHSYEELVADPDLDVIYVATPHSFHLAHGLLAIAAGKGLMVEKPAGLGASDVETLVEAARKADVFFMEAYKCRNHPQTARLIELVRDGVIGKLTHIEAKNGGFKERDPASRLFDPALGGGGILDIGCYPVTTVRLIAGAAKGLPYAEPVTLEARGEVGPTGVDEIADAELDFGDGLTASIACALRREMDDTLVLTGTKGTIRLPVPWRPGRNAGPSDAKIVIETEDGTREEWLRDPRQLFAFEAEAATNAILAGMKTAPWPALSGEESVLNARVIDRWREGMGLPVLASARSA